MTAMDVPLSWLEDAARQVRGRQIAWDGHQRAGFITEEELDMIRRYDNKGAATQNELLATQGQKYGALFLHLLGKITADQTVQYLILLVDDLLSESRDRAKLFHACNTASDGVLPYAPFLSLLRSRDAYTRYASNKILSVLLSTGRPLDTRSVSFYAAWLSNELTSADESSLSVVLSALQAILSVEQIRNAFYSETKGVELLIDVIDRRRPNFQIQYQVVFCFWLLTFTPSIADTITIHPVVNTLSLILKGTTKEKVVRIILATLRNLLEKVKDSKHNAAQMIGAKVLEAVTLLQTKQYADEDMVEDIKFVLDELQKAVNELSSFDQYAGELRSGNLQWSPVHRSERFWLENAVRFNDNKFEMLRLLATVLQSSTDPTVLAVAAHDVGSYVRYVDGGKKTLESLGIKTAVMHLMAHRDDNVRYEALLAVQKLMVTNWEYLGRNVTTAKDRLPKH
ncbi:vacuolar proton pump subunit H [Capsaspora owczarzaki ATCC 30864]|uniref:V-type proton ATPase subunit H n=1 Tax=Capsaspora owczarzaki (strain ATCC 30864) TaxID=595528 RepID=A0A0D2X0D2_CAPO3|nr:vacuolar proton pump subunit H [Capsaspora owczarzaki ATCC 30864]KJE88854.1 vacuolar proton pump subunit H [Capsaspora owczarzaki ATCC 30864]|eukprot:XP_004365301.1 vacuolar proton pump subunit H [Capsaspora owczarzaki ATCC 30864]